MKQTDDIPEARREPMVNSSGVAPSWPWTGAAIIALALVGLSSVNWLRQALAPRPLPAPTVTIPSPSPIPNILGHLPYPEAPRQDLVPITADGKILLRSAAARQFQLMQAAARKKGVVLVPLSGFRTIKEQEYLFFGVKAQRNQEARRRAEVSAPPNYSEHHTGYAIDIGDGQTPATNLSQSFAKTKAFQWLKQNAATYSFELSFPPDNAQGISYEPWHWRYVGDSDSLKTFYQAQQLQKK